MTNPNDVIAEFRADSGSVTPAMGGTVACLDLVLLPSPRTALRHGVHHPRWLT
jgi:hypothetical protein